MTWECPAPHRGHDRESQMTNSDKERSEKHGVLETDRARKLDKTKDADAADEDDEDDESE